MGCRESGAGWIKGGLSGGHIAAAIRETAAGAICQDGTQLTLALWKASLWVMLSVRDLGLRSLSMDKSTSVSHFLLKVRGYTGLNGVIPKFMSTRTCERGLAWKWGLCRCRDEIILGQGRAGHTSA